MRAAKRCLNKREFSLSIHRRKQSPFMVGAGPWFLPGSSFSHKVETQKWANGEKDNRKKRRRRQGDAPLGEAWIEARRSEGGRVKMMT